MTAKEESRKPKQEQREGRHRPRFLGHMLMKVKPLSANRILANHRMTGHSEIGRTGAKTIPGGNSPTVQESDRSRETGHTEVSNVGSPLSLRKGLPLTLQNFRVRGLLAHRPSAINRLCRVRCDLK